MLNVISAYLNGRAVCTTQTVYQYNSGMRLQFAGPELPDSYEVDFANSVNGSSVTQIGGAEGVSIPDQFFVPGSTIHAWVVLVGTDYVVTRYHIMIPISPRATRTNEEPTPNQQSALDQAIGALNEGVARAETAAESAEESASHYPRINAGYWEIWNPVTGAYESTGVQAQGPQGDPGSDWQDATSRVSPLNGTPIAGATVLETVGIPLYVSDVSSYAGYGITDTGWYVFARITAPEGVAVTANTTVTGAAGYITTVGANHVDVAVRFEVAAQSQAVTVGWGDSAETYVFKATDLAVRNLDYRTTFYIYDIAPYTAWTYALTADTTFSATKRYYTRDGDTYSLATVTAGEAVPADTYYNHSKVRFEGMASNVTYRLDETVDCPIEIALPDIADDGHGAWFEIQLRYDGSYSCTLLPPDGVKIGTAQTQAQTAGVNTIDLQYTDVDDVRMWTLLNTHSNIPA